MLSLREYMTVKGYDGIASFFHIIPDQAYSLVLDSDILKLLKNNAGTGSNHYKTQIYNKFFNLEHRIKYTGFENLSEWDNTLRKGLVEKYGKSNYITEKVGIPEKFLAVIPGLVGITNFKDACLYAAKKAKELAGNKEIFVCLSGGLDSEFAAICFKNAGIEFKAFIVDYNGKNEHDIQYAKKWCVENNVECVVEQIDLENFAENELYTFAQLTEVSSPQILTYQKMIQIVNEKYNAYPILGGELRLVYDNGDLMFSYQWEKGEMHGMVTDEK